jgi:pimeloyl-ACP methyl ester carboxylesterase
LRRPGSCPWGVPRGRMCASKPHARRRCLGRGFAIMPPCASSDLPAGAVRARPRCFPRSFRAWWRAVRWGQYFLSKGYAVYIMDQVGRGRSPYVEAVYGPKSMRSPKSVERDFIAYEKYNLFPQAKLHTQWPGSGAVGDPIFDQFIAETLPMIGDAKVREAVNRDATIALLDQIGPAILMPHSQSAAPVWLVADARPQLVKALLMVEAGTSSFYEVKLVGPPHWFEDGPLAKPFGLTYAPITYDPPVNGVEDFGLVRQEKPDAPELARCWRQNEPVHKLINLHNIPTLLSARSLLWRADRPLQRRLSETGRRAGRLHSACRDRHSRQRPLPDAGEEQSRYRRRDRRLAR